MSIDGGHRLFAPLLVILKRSTIVGLFVVVIVVVVFFVFFLFFFDFLIRTGIFPVMPLTGFTFLNLFGLLECVVMWLISMLV